VRSTRSAVARQILRRCSSDVSPEPGHLVEPSSIGVGVVDCGRIKAPISTIAPYIILYREQAWKSSHFSFAILNSCGVVNHRTDRVNKCQPVATFYRLHKTRWRIPLRLLNHLTASLVKIASRREGTGCPKRCRHLVILHDSLNPP